MAAPKGFLYGDSTPSPLKSDFIAFLGDAFDFAVDVLLCDARLTTAGQRLLQLSEATEREIEVADSLSVDVARALDVASVRDPGSLAARCAARILQGARDLIRSESDAARAAVAAERTRASEAAASDSEACAKAFQTLVLRHTLPDSVGVMRINLESGLRYDAQLHSHTPYGLEWITQLEVPASHPLSEVLRLDRVVERLEIEAPEEGGWIHKEVRIRAQRFDRFYLTALSVHPAETTVRLRSGADGSGAGFDVLFRLEPVHVELVRVLEGGDPPESPYRVLGDDVTKLQALREALVAMAGDLAEHKKALRQATLDGTPLQKLDSPRVLVDKIVTNIAPTVQEIAKRSLAPGELVLKRLLGDNHREEIFVSTADLRRKTERLSVDLRAAFEPLGLWETTAAPPPAASPAASSRPAPEHAPVKTAGALRLQEDPIPLMPSKTVAAAPIHVISPQAAANAPAAASQPAAGTRESARPPSPSSPSSRPPRP
jgi:hypothetical protein